MRLTAVAFSLCVAGALPVLAQDAGTDTPPELRDFRLDAPPAPTPEPVVPAPVPSQEPPDTPRATAAPPARSTPPPVNQPSRQPNQNAPSEEPSAEPVVEASQVVQTPPTDTTESPASPLPADATPEPSATTGFSTAQLGIATLLSLIILSVGLLIWRRRSERPRAPEKTGSRPTLTARATPPATEPAAPKPPTAPAPSKISMAFVPRNAMVSVKSLTLKGELQITNSGNSSAEHLSLRVGLVSASKQQKDAINHFFAQPQAVTSSPIVFVNSGDQIGLNLELSIALDEMQTFVVDGKSLLVPILVASLSDASGELARVTCMVGREATPPQPKMGPLRLDQGPRSFDRLGQRALVS
ncbi:MAG: hypothetical protein ACK4ZE_11665 [Sphingorhabdus sp.]